VPRRLMSSLFEPLSGTGLALVESGGVNGGMTESIGDSSGLRSCATMSLIRRGASKGGTAFLGEAGGNGGKSLDMEDHNVGGVVGTAMGADVGGGGSGIVERSSENRFDIAIGV